MKTITVNENEYETYPLLRAVVPISFEVQDLLETEYLYEFDYNICDVYTSNCVDDALSDIDRCVKEYNLSNEDVHTLHDIVALFEKVDVVTLERAL